MMDLNQTNVFFWYDYLLIAIVIGSSVGIGIYFGFFGKKQNNKKEYLLAGKSMSVFPVAVSLISSSISGITTLSYPADVYKYGSNLIWLCIALPIVCIVEAYMILPIFFELQLTSVYEYLETRFNKECRLVTSFMALISMFVYNATVIYIPSIAFSQATNINISYISIFLSVFCVFYTTIGGLKAVVWTDAYQFIGMVASTVGVIVVGFNAVGGAETVWYNSVSSNRTDFFDFRFDMKLRYNFWTIILAGTTHWASYTIVNQGFAQKCLSLPTIRKAQKAVFIFTIGVMFFMFSVVLTGNIMYSKYKDCDPLEAHLISRHDQLVPYFVMDISEHLPGLLGVFMSGCLCAALSTFSSMLNTIASLVYEDFLSKVLSNETKDKREGLILKLLVLIAGVTCTLLSLLIEKSNEILPIVSSIQGVTLGPILGIFILGTFIPLATPQAAFISCITSLIFASWLSLGHIINVMKGLLIDQSKPLSVEGCSNFVNTTQIYSNTEEIFVLYQISFWYYLLIGTVATVILGVLLSFVTKKNEKPVNKELFSPVIRQFLK